MLEVVLTNLKISEPEVLDEMLLFKFHIQTIEKSYIYIHIEYIKDCRQITFVMLNGFCLLSKTPPPPHPLVLKEQYQDG